VISLKSFGVEGSAADAPDEFLGAAAGLNALHLILLEQAELGKRTLRTWRRVPASSEIEYLSFWNATPRNPFPPCGSIAKLRSCGAILPFPPNACAPNFILSWLLLIRTRPIRSCATS
jgi:hypothetical protein